MRSEVTLDGLDIRSEVPLEHLDAAVMRRFTFKVQMAALDEGKVKFFSRYFKSELNADDMRTPPAAPSADEMPVWNLARHRAAVEHVLTRTAISDQSRRIYRELLATGDNCAKVARRMNLPAATVGWRWDGNAIDSYINAMVQYARFYAKNEKCGGRCNDNELFRMLREIRREGSD